MRTTNRYDYCVLGAGPAGLQLGYFFEQAKRSYVILERGDTPGTFFKKFPRHRKLISVNKVFTGHSDQEINYRWDWNALLCDDQRLMFRNFSNKYFPQADELVHYLKEFASDQALNVQCGVDVQRVSRTSEGFELVDQLGQTILCRRLIVATGVSVPYIPKIPGIELCEQYEEVSVDPADFTNQRVLIIGKGNSAFETADNLVDTTALIHVASPRPVKFAWQSHFVGHLRAVNNNLLDTYLLKCQNATLEVEILGIEKNSNGKFDVSVSYQRAEGSRDSISYDRIICCTGFQLDRSIFDDSCRPQLTIMDRFPALDSSWQSVNVPDLYFAGTLMQSRDFKKTTSGFIHGFRYNLRALSKILGERYHSEKIRGEEIESCPEKLAEAVLRQVNRSSALWQQFGFLGDIIVPHYDGEKAAYFQGLPVAYVHDHPFVADEDYFTVTLEYGFHEDDDPFRSKRVAHTDAMNAAKSTFLHPVIRRFCNGQALDECHIVENLEANWNDRELHFQPLRAYFAERIPAKV